MELVDREGIVVETFRFRINEDEVRIRQTVKAYKDELNVTPPAIVGAIDDAPADVPVVPTQAELDKIEWDADVAKLKKAYSDMINLGVTLSAGQLTALTTLRNKIATNFKNEYLG